MLTPGQIVDPQQRKHHALRMIGDLNGKWFKRGCLIKSVGAPIEVTNPAYNQNIGYTANCTREEVDSAVDAAAVAFPAWSALEGSERAALLKLCSEVIRNNAEELAILLALESGKAHRTECVGEVNLLAEIFSYFAGFGTEFKGRTTPFSNSVLAITSREPVGVVAGVIPWNMPLMFLGYKVAAPLIAGNAVVLKVPEIVPFTVLKVLELIGELLPAGVINAVVGYGTETGQALIENPNIQKISFTGSVETGRSVYVTAAQNLKQVNLELGGKAPMLVLPDCSVNTAVYGAISGIRFTRQAQSCTSSTRVYLPRRSLDEFMEKAVAEAGKLKIGDPLDDATDTGAIVSCEQKERIQGFIDRAIKEEQTPIVTGSLPETGGLERGAFIQPHFFVEPPHDSEIVQKEIFGPVMCVFGYETLEELVFKANDVEYGLSASIWGNDISSCLHVAKKMEVGFTQINQNAVMLPGLSYAGTKASGFGSESSLESMLQSFTREKTTIINTGNFSSLAFDH